MAALARVSILRVRVRLEIKLEPGLGLLTRRPLSRERYETRVGERVDLTNAFPLPRCIATNGEAAAAVSGTTLSVKILIVVKCCFMSVARTTWGRERRKRECFLRWERRTEHG